MKKRLYSFGLSIIVLSAALFQCSEEEISKQAFIGTWAISEVKYDGVLQNNWTGTEITFKQLTERRGTYTLPHTPDASIWSLSGEWNETTDTDFMRDDDILVTYGVQNDGGLLILEMYLPWTQQSTCNGDVCLPIVTGQWTFKLEQGK